MRYAFFATGIFAMILGLGGMLPYVDVALPMSETWTADQLMAAIHLSLQAALMGLGAITMSCSIR